MYQLRRTTFATVAHMSLPLLYCLGLSCFDKAFSVVCCLLCHCGCTNALYVLLQSNAFQWTLLACLVWMIGLAVFLIGIGLAVYWFYEDWKRHPLKVQLEKTGLSWRFGWNFLFQPSIKCLLLGVLPDLLILSFVICRSSYQSLEAALWSLQTHGYSSVICTVSM